MPEPNAVRADESTDASGEDVVVQPPDEASASEPATEVIRRVTPRQARRIRILLSAAVMCVVAVALVVRLESAPSVLIVGFYGIALILSGTAIGLSRRGRTRVATGVLGLGFLLVVAGEWLLRG